MNETKKSGSGQLLKSSAVVSSMTLISRVFGLIRDMVIAYFFGAAAGADAFFLAFRIPNFFRRLFAEGAFAQSFVPVLSEYRTRRQPEEVKALVDMDFHFEFSEQLQPGPAARAAAPASAS